MSAYSTTPMQITMLQTTLILLIKAYKLTVSPFLGRSCRFYPSCSSYAIEAVERYGAVAGSWLAVKRLGRCHPWNEGGLDAVPDRPASGPHCGESQPCAGSRPFPPAI